MPSRADNDIFDFNDTQAERAAKAVTPRQLVSLFDALDRADELRETDPKAATRKALYAVVKFLTASPHNGNGRFSRPLELLLAQGGKTLASSSGSGGVLTRRAEQHVKAGAAFVVNALHEAGVTRKDAASRVVEVLAAHRFPVGKRRKRPIDGVLAWRRDFPRGNDPAALAYQELVRKPPFALDEPSKSQQRTALNWLSALLSRAGYGAVA